MAVVPGAATSPIASGGAEGSVAAGRANAHARGACRAVLLDACTAAGFSPPFHVEASDYPTALAFVAAGLGMTVMPVLGTLAMPPGLHTVRVVRPVPVRTITAVVRDAAAHAPPVRTALEVLTEVAGASA